MPAAVVPVPVTSSSLPPHHFPLTVSYGCVPRSRFIRLRKLPSEAVRHTSPVQIFPACLFLFFLCRCSFILRIQLSHYQGIHLFLQCLNYLRLRFFLPYEKISHEQKEQFLRNLHILHFNRPILSARPQQRNVYIFCNLAMFKTAFLYTLHCCVLPLFQLYFIQFPVPCVVDFSCPDTQLFLCVFQCSFRNSQFICPVKDFVAQNRILCFRKFP